MIRLNTARKNILRDESGTTAVLFGLMISPMVILSGLAVDYAKSLRLRDQMQVALDAAVLAAAQLPTTTPSERSAMVDMAESYFAANYKNGELAYSKSEGQSKVAVTFTPIANNGGIRASAVADLPMMFGGLAYTEKMTVEIKASVRQNNSVVPGVAGDIPCIHVMDQNGAGTLTLDSNEQLDAANCGVRVRSNNNASVMEDDSDRVKFKRIETKGKALVESDYHENELKIAELPNKVVTNAQVTGNPYVSAIADVVNAISVGSCSNSNTNKTWSGVVSPGTYCGTTEFKDAQLNPGLYIIASGNGNGKEGRLKLNGTITMRTVGGAQGVSFFLADNKAELAQYAPVDGTVLKAPTTGTTRGLLIFERSNRGSNYDIAIQTCKTNSIQGLIYLPSANVTIQGLEDFPLFNISIAANQLKIKNLERINWAPYAWTPFNKSTPIATEGTAETIVRDSFLLE